jgi:hypothetical protein
LISTDVQALFADLLQSAFDKGVPGMTFQNNRTNPFSNGSKSQGRRPAMEKPGLERASRAQAQGTWSQINTKSRKATIKSIVYSVPSFQDWMNLTGGFSRGFTPGYNIAVFQPGQAC